MNNEKWEGRSRDEDKLLILLSLLGNNAFFIHNIYAAKTKTSTTMSFEMGYAFLKTNIHPSISLLKTFRMGVHKFALVKK